MKIFPGIIARGHRDGVLKAGVQQAAADSRESQTCVCASTFPGGGTCRERRMNEHPAVVPSSRRGNTSSESRRRENRAAQKG